MPSAASVSCAAVSWPWPPSMRTRSGQGEFGFLLAVDDAGRAVLRRRVSQRRHHRRRRRRARRLVDQPLEAAAQHLPHHAEVVAGREIGGADVELAILVLLKALRTGDDHGADRVAALDVAVVVDLDAPRHSRQREGLGQQLQQLALRRGLGELARQRLARIGERVIDQILLLAALGHARPRPCSRSWWSSASASSARSSISCEMKMQRGHGLSS